MKYPTESQCSHRCGYVSHGQDLAAHERREHEPCPECGAGDGQDLGTYAVTHEPDCPRLHAPSGGQP